MLLFKQKDIYDYEKIFYKPAIIYFNTVRICDATSLQQLRNHGKKK